MIPGTAAVPGYGTQYHVPRTVENRVPDANICCCCCCLHIKPFFLPNDISSDIYTRYMICTYVYVMYDAATRVEWRQRKVLRISY